MHLSSIASYQYLQLNPIQVGNRIPLFVDENAPSICQETSWGFAALNVLIPILERFFPHYEVLYAIEDDPDSNAWVCPLPKDLYLVTVHVGAIRSFMDFGIRFSKSLNTLVELPEETAILKVLGDRLEEGQLLNLVSSLCGYCALAAILGHELGHIHEGQFKASHPITAPAMVNHGTEFAADGWSVWVAASIAEAVMKPIREDAYEDSQMLACDQLQSTIVLAAFSCIDDIEINQPWTPANPLDPDDTHPIAVARLSSAAVSLLDWWEKRMGRRIESAAPVIVKALARVLSGHGAGSQFKDAQALLELILNQYLAASPYIEESRTQYQQWVR